MLLPPIYVSMLNNSPPRRSPTYFLSKVSIADKTFSAQTQSAIIATVSNCLNIYIQTSPTSLGQHIDVPLQNVREVICEQQANKKSSQQNVLHLALEPRHGHAKTMIWNGLTKDDCTLKMRFDSQDSAADFKNLLQSSDTLNSKFSLRTPHDLAPPTKPPANTAKKFNTLSSRVAHLGRSSQDQENRQEAHQNIDHGELNLLESAPGMGATSISDPLKEFSADIPGNSGRFSKRDHEASGSHSGAFSNPNRNSKRKAKEMGIASEFAEQQDYARSPYATKRRKIAQPVMQNVSPNKRITQNLRDEDGKIKPTESPLLSKKKSTTRANSPKQRGGTSRTQNKTLRRPLKLQSASTRNVISEGTPSVGAKTNDASEYDFPPSPVDTSRQSGKSQTSGRTKTKDKPHAKIAKAQSSKTNAKSSAGPAKQPTRPRTQRTAAVQANKKIQELSDDEEGFSADEMAVPSPEELTIGQEPEKSTMPAQAAPTSGDSPKKLNPRKESGLYENKLSTAEDAIQDSLLHDALSDTDYHNPRSPENDITSQTDEQTTKTTVNDKETTVENNRELHDHTSLSNAPPGDILDALRKLTGRTSTVDSGSRLQDSLQLLQAAIQAVMEDSTATDPAPFIDQVAMLLQPNSAQKGKISHDIKSGNDHATSGDAEASASRSVPQTLKANSVGPVKASDHGQSRTKPISSQSGHALVPDLAAVKPMASIVLVAESSIEPIAPASRAIKSDAVQQSALENLQDPFEATLGRPQQETLGLGGEKQIDHQKMIKESLPNYRSRTPTPIIEISSGSPPTSSLDSHLPDQERSATMSLSRAKRKPSFEFGEATKKRKMKDDGLSRLSPNEESTPITVPHKQVMISFSKSGPRNQGKRALVRPKSALPVAFSKGVFDRGVEVSHNDPAEPLFAEERLARGEQLTYAPVGQGFKYKPSSQNTRVTSNGSPMPLAQAGHTTEANSSSAESESDPEDVASSVVDALKGDTLLPQPESPQLPKTSDLFAPVAQMRFQVQRMLKNQKLEPSSPNQPSEVSALPAHHVYATGVIVNPQTKETIVPSKPADPFTMASSDSTSSFMRMLRQTDRGKGKRVPDEAQLERPVKRRKSPVENSTQDPDLTLVNSSPAHRQNSSDRGSTPLSRSPVDHSASPQRVEQQASKVGKTSWSSEMQKHHQNLQETLAESTQVSLYPPP